MGFTHLFYGGNYDSFSKSRRYSKITGVIGQILLVHHYARPDVFKSEGSKFTDTDLEAVINDPINLFLYMRMKKAVS